MATYNRAHFIVETLKSIQAQTYTNWECIIIDDGGTDNTLEVITPILEKDTRFVFLKRPETYRKGLPGCRNYGLDKAQGDYIIFFDDDDIVHPDNMKSGVVILEKEKVDFFHYQRKSFSYKHPKFCEVKNNVDGFISKTDIEHVVTNKIGLASCSILWKKKCFIDIRFNSSLQYAEEWECYTRLLLKGYKGVLTKDILYFNRKHNASNTGEFFKNKPSRIKSKIKATHLVFYNLNEKGMLTPVLFKYLTSIPIMYRCKKELRKMIAIEDISVELKVYTCLRYNLYPVWRFFKTIKR